MEEKIRTKLEELRGFLQADGGDLEIVSIEGKNVTLALKGACGGCPHATMTIKDGVLDGGEFAHIYFIDWDQVRARHRQLNITVMGTTGELEEDRKWNNGEVINTLHKFTDEEKAYDLHYDLQLKR